MIPSSYPRDRTAIIMAGSRETMTYGELECVSNQIAHLFRDLGLTRGDGVAVCLENHLMYLPLYWGAFRCGLYFTAISYRLQPEEVEYIVNDCEAKVLITSSELADTFHELKNGLNHKPACFMLDGTADGVASLEEAIKAFPTTTISDQSFGSSLLYSSGTTGRPKGIRRELPPFAWGDFASMQLPNRYGFAEDTVYLSPAPLYHAAPLHTNVAVMRNGGTVVIMEHFDAEQTLRLVENHRVTHSQFVPTMFVRMLRLDQDVQAKYDLSSLQVAIHAAAPCPIDVKEKMIQWWGKILYEYYAGTEAIGRTDIDSHQWLAQKGSVGKATDCVVHILDEDDNELLHGETGGVYFESEARFEYLKDPEKTASSISQQGWRTLGDVGYLDENGYLYLTDRKSFMIISGGVNIYPQETENALLSHPKVMDVAVFGVPNPDLGEEVKAVVQPVDISQVGAEFEAELIAYARSKIAHLKCPSSIDFMEELPRHPTGKLYKRVLKDKYWQ